MQPGPYVLTVEKQGFKTAQVSTFDIQVNQALTQSIRLDLGQVNESIAANAEAPLLQSSTSELGMVISETPLKEFYLDGILSTDIRGAFYGVLPILDTLNEFKVQSQNDKAEFGGTLGGVVNVATKPGTNNFHAAAWAHTGTLGVIHSIARTPRELQLGAKFVF